MTRDEGHGRLLDLLVALERLEVFNGARGHLGRDSVNVGVLLDPGVIQCVYG